MVSEDTIQPPSRRILAGIEGRSRSHPAIVALAIYVVASLAMWGRPLLHSSLHECVCAPSTTDEGVYAWAMWWWPHALLHGLNPFHPHSIYALRGINIAQGTGIPGAALILAPVTAIAGPLFAFNVAMLLSPALAAFFAFLLCRRLTHEFWPSLLGGWLFGFSTYMLGQLTGHLSLTLVFPVPAIVHLVVLKDANEIGSRRFVVALTAALTLLFLFALELFASMTLFGAVALVVWFALGDAGLRARLRSLLAPVAISYVVTAVLVSPYLVYALKPGGLPILPRFTDTFSNDLLAFVVPSPYSGIGGTHFLATTARFTAGPVEGAAYIGIPLLLVVLLAARGAWKRVEVRAMIVTLVVVALCSLGGRLHINGDSTIWLPWSLVHRLPVLGQMLPGRFAAYAFLICAVLAAMWLAASDRRVAPWLLALASAAFLFPSFGHGYWRSVRFLPRLFTHSAYRHAIGPRDVALVLPVGIEGESMLWHAETHIGFTMAGGYFVDPNAPDPYSRYAIHPTLTYGYAVSNQLEATRQFLDAEHVSVVLLDPRWVATPTWTRILEQLGWGRPRLNSGVLITRPAGGSSARFASR